jgi:hypothetical protein
MFGAPAEVAVSIQKREKPKKINPNGMDASPGRIYAFFTGLPFQMTLS